MLTSSRAVPAETTSVPPVVMSTSSQSVASKSASDPVPVQVFEGHEDWVICLRFCPDEDKLVTGSGDNTLRVWNRPTGAVEVLRGHDFSVWDIDVSWDGKMVVSCSADKTVRIWGRELGETMLVFQGHKYWVESVQFSADASRVVSCSYDETVQVWSVETGELTFEPIKCHGKVRCARYSPSGDRIASGASSVQIWNAETGSGIISIRNSEVFSVAWTADGTYVIGGREGEVTIWNSQTGEQLRTWKAHEDWIRLSLSPSGSHLATSAWHDHIAFVFDVSTGQPILALEHNENVQGIAYSPSGNFIATGSEDGKVYLWEAPVAEHPPAKSSAPPFSSLLDRPAIPLVGPSQNDARGFDAFWDTLPSRNQQAPPQLKPQRVFNKVRDTFTNVFARRPAGAAQTTPQGAVRETVGVVEVAAGRDKTFWVVVAIPTYSAMEKILYTLIHCRRPEDPDEEVPTATGTNSSQTAANNAHAATINQSGRPEMGDGAETPPIVAGNLVIRTQPRHSPAMRLSDETPGGEPHSSEFSGRNSRILNQFESIETVTIPETSTMSAHASLQPSPSTDRLSSMIPSCELPSSTTPVTSEPLTVPSPEEMALIEEYRRLKGKSVVVRIAAEPLSGPAHGLDSCVPRDHSTSPSQSHDPVTPSASSMPLPISRQTSLRINKGPLDITPALLSPSPLSASSRPPHSLHQPSITGDVQSLGLTASVGNTVVEARGNIKMVSSASPVADEADRQRDIFHLQKQNEQLRRQLNDAVAAMRKAEAERDGLATGSAGAGPSSRQDGPPGGSELIADPQADHSAFSNVSSQGHPSGSAQFISGLIEAEKRVNKKMKENTPSDPTNKATDSPHSVHPPHRREPPRDDATTASPASTAADVANLQRGLLQMQEQLDQLRRRFDDPKH